MNNNYYCIIMAGGTGTRFWPLSRAERPKQFLDVLGKGRTFLQSTFDRFVRIVPAENILVVTSDHYRDLVVEQLPEIPLDNILLEPFKRNTAPCVAYATYKLLAKNPDATVVVTPADHQITELDHFEDTIRTALDFASGSASLFTIGIKPTRPDTNYGYIQYNKATMRTIGDISAFEVKTFTEKPNEELATVFLKTGEFLWNSGMFIWKLSSIKRELEACLPEVAGFFSCGNEVYYTPGEADFIRHAYGECPAISIDYGVMEKASCVRVFLSTFGWSDVGTWTSAYERSPNKDEDGNIVKGANTLIYKVKGSVVREDRPGKLLVVRGLENYMVIDSDDVLMICPRDDKSVKEIVAEITAKEKSEYL